MCLTLACVALQLITVIRQDLNLTKSGVSGANVAAITGTIFARVASAPALSFPVRVHAVSCHAPTIVAKCRHPLPAVAAAPR
jgi:hypothetical protein